MSNDGGKMVDVVRVPGKSSSDKPAYGACGKAKPPGLGPAAVHALIDKHFPEARDDIGAIEILNCDNDSVAVRMPYEDRFRRPGGTISGPTMFKLADMACYIAILDRLGEAAIEAVTTTLTINFLARPSPADLIGEVAILRQGQRQVVCDVRIFSGSERQLVAQASCIYALPRK